MMKTQTKKETGTRIQNEISRLLTPYSEHWENYKQHSYCFLTEYEVQILELAMQHGKLSIVAKILNRPAYKISDNYCHIKRKLRSNLRCYEQWIDEIPFYEPGEIKTAAIKKAEFLNAPFHSRYFPYHLGKMLSMFGDNLFDVLTEFGEKELLKSRWFGQRLIVKLKAVLSENNCEDLLRASIKRQVLKRIK